MKVGHSIGSYISIDMFKRSSKKVMTTFGKFNLFDIIMLPPHVLLTLKCLFVDISAGFIGDILHWAISIFGLKPAINRAVYYWKNCSVKFFLCYE